MFRALVHSFHRLVSVQSSSSLKIARCAVHFNLALSSKNPIDYSRVPVLKELDLEEQMVRGSGPGGQATNTTNNCVVLKHKPTGIVVKCHALRMASSNRKEARRLMVERLDAHFNGELSVANQIKQLEMKKSAKNTSKRKKLDEMKRQWKERENIDWNEYICS